MHHLPGCGPISALAERLGTFVSVLNWWGLGALESVAQALQGTLNPPPPTRLGMGVGQIQPDWNQKIFGTNRRSCLKQWQKKVDKQLY